MPQPMLEEEVRYTYADYLTWDDDKRWELIGGIPYLMLAPTTAHQGVSGELFRQIANFLVGKQCKVFSAPLDVRLFPRDGDLDDTVVQPDIVVICDREKITRRCCEGAPDMAIEILSPSSVQHDTLRKFRLYQNAGIREYWIVNTESKTLMTHLLKDGYYVTSAYGEGDSAPVHVLDGLSINLADVFAEAE